MTEVGALFCEAILNFDDETDQKADQSERDIRDITSPESLRSLDKPIAGEALLHQTEGLRDQLRASVRFTLSDPNEDHQHHRSKLRQLSSRRLSGIDALEVATETRESVGSILARLGSRADAEPPDREEEPEELAFQVSSSSSIPTRKVPPKRREEMADFSSAGLRVAKRRADVKMRVKKARDGEKRQKQLALEAEALAKKEAAEEARLGSHLAWLFALLPGMLAQLFASLREEDDFEAELRRLEEELEKEEQELLERERQEEEDAEEEWAQELLEEMGYDEEDDGNGYIDRNEVVEAMKALGESLDDETW
eukprot:Skav207977  [mRNA]  locus=scaffold3328:21495:28326:- [translate_table: standard]